MLILCKSYKNTNKTLERAYGSKEAMYSSILVYYNLTFET